MTPARWPDEREAERLRQSLAGLVIDAVEDGRLEQALRQWDHDSEVVEDREDHSVMDSGGDVLPRPAPEDITEGIGVVPYPLPLRTQDGPAEEKPLLSLLEPMPTLETKTDDGISSTCQPLPREAQGHGQGPGRRRKLPMASGEVAMVGGAS